MNHIAFLNANKIDFDNRLEISKFEQFESFEKFFESAPDDIFVRSHGRDVIITKELSLSEDLIMELSKSVKMICEAGTRYRSTGAPDFEIIAGRLLGENIATRSIAMVRVIDGQSAKRVQVALANAGPGRKVEVFTDGVAQLRQWQMEAVPDATHILDWCHLRKRVEMLDKVLHRKNTAKLIKHKNLDLLSSLFGHMLWRLWHGQYQEAIRRLNVMMQIFKGLFGTGRSRPKPTVVSTLTSDLLRYLQNNVDSLPNYGLRWQNGQRISSAFVESAVNQIIDKRMSKSQQMRWDPKSAHQLLQVRVRVIDCLLRDDFARWYPGFPANESSMVVVA